MVEVWKPAITVDLNVISSIAFYEALKTFEVWSNQTPQETDLPVTDGFCDITPEISEKLLRRNQQNRKVSLLTVKKYARRMMTNEWHKTGQPIILSDDGYLQDGQHRLYAGYLSGTTFPCYVITNAPATADFFAYLDDGYGRKPADALETAGINGGLSGTIAGAVKLAWRYDNRALGILKQPAIRAMDNIEVLAYARGHLDLVKACHDMVSTFSRAVAVIGSRGIAGFVAWKITTLHGPQHLEDFMVPLGTGVNLEQDSPIAALRRRLQAENIDDYSALHILALIIKAFNLHLDGGTVKRSLSLRDDEHYPLFEDAVPQTEAAE